MPSTISTQTIPVTPQPKPIAPSTVSKQPVREQSVQEKQENLLQQAPIPLTHSQRQLLGFDSPVTITPTEKSKDTKPKPGGALSLEDRIFKLLEVIIEKKEQELAPKEKVHTVPREESTLKYPTPSKTSVETKQDELNKVIDQFNKAAGETNNSIGR